MTERVFHSVQAIGGVAWYAALNDVYVKNQKTFHVSPARTLIPAGRLGHSLRV